MTGCFLYDFQFTRTPAFYIYTVRRHCKNKCVDKNDDLIYTVSVGANFVVFRGCCDDTGTPALFCDFAPAPGHADFGADFALIRRFPLYIYVLLTRSATIPARIIRLFTGDRFSHASIAFDPRLDTLCSFARIHTGFPLPAGLIREDLSKGVFGRNPFMECKLLTLSVDPYTYDRAFRLASAMLQRKKRYGYNLWGLILCRYGIVNERSRHLFCSQFVAKILSESGAVVLPKPASLTRPQDFDTMDGFITIYKGSLYGLVSMIRANYSYKAIAFPVMPLRGRQT